MGALRRWPVRTWIGLCLVLSALAGLTWWLLSWHTRGAEIAAVLALPVGVAAVAVPFYQGKQRDPAKPLSRRVVPTTEEAGAAQVPVSGRDAHALGVQRARSSVPAVASQRLGLTPYLSRGHDRELRDRIDETASGGPSMLAVLIGDSTIGKTRALYEALLCHEVVRQWPLLAPVDADQLSALLDGQNIVPGMVLWLDEIQKYLFGAAGAGAARGLSRLLNATQKIIVVGTTWLTHLTELSTPGRAGDPYSDARLLLTGPHTHRIFVPERLTREQCLALATNDPRLSEAATASVEGGRVIQHLTGGPELLDAYRSSGFFSLDEHALINAAIDARRFGHHEPVSGELLAAAADGYMTPEQRPGSSDWAAIALAAITSGKRLDGSRTDVRSLTALRALREASGQHTARYKPDDFLEQHVGDSRHASLGPAQLWDALALHTAETDIYQVGHAAYERGLYRYAALLWRRAAASGDIEAGIDLLEVVSRLDATATRGVCVWVAQRASLNYPFYCGKLLQKLDELGMEEAIAIYVARDPVSNIPPDDLWGIGHLLAALQQVGATNAIRDLLALDPTNRLPIGSAPDENIYDLLDLVNALTKVHATDAAARLANRITSQLTLDNADWEIYTSEIMWLVESLHEAQQMQAAATLAKRVAVQLPLDDTLHLAFILKGLHKLKLSPALNTLASRAAQEMPLGHGVGDVIEALHGAGATREIDILVGRAAREMEVTGYTPDHYLLLSALSAAGALAELAILADQAALDDPCSVTLLLGDLADFDADDAVQVLLSRGPAGKVSLTRGTCGLLSVLRDVGAEDAIRLLLSRHPASQVNLNDPADVASLLEDLAEVGADDEQLTLLSRDPAGKVLIQELRGVSYLLDAMCRVGDRDSAFTVAERASREAQLRDPQGDRFQLRERDVIYLLESMHRAGAISPMTVLASRVAHEFPLDKENDVSYLLKALHEIGANEAIDTLLARDPAAQVDVTSISFMMPGDDLATVLLEIGANDAAEALTRRRANAGNHGRGFAKLVEQMPDGELKKQLLRYGREPDFLSSHHWSWESLS
jgi:hypothetical protein